MRRRPHLLAALAFGSAAALYAAAWLGVIGLINGHLSWTLGSSLVPLGVGVVGGLVGAMSPRWLFSSDGRNAVHVGLAVTTLTYLTVGLVFVLMFAVHLPNDAIVGDVLELLVGFGTTAIGGVPFILLPALPVGGLVARSIHLWALRTTAERDPQPSGPY